MTWHRDYREKPSQKHSSRKLGTLAEPLQWNVQKMADSWILLAKAKSQLLLKDAASEEVDDLSKRMNTLLDALMAAGREFKIPEAKITEYINYKMNQTPKER